MLWLRFWETKANCATAFLIYLIHVSCSTPQTQSCRPNNAQNLPIGLSGHYTVACSRCLAITQNCWKRVKCYCVRAHESTLVPQQYANSHCWDSTVLPVTRERQRCHCLSFIIITLVLYNRNRYRHWPSNTCKLWRKTKSICVWLRPTSWPIFLL